MENLVLAYAVENPGFSGNMLLRSLRDDMDPDVNPADIAAVLKDLSCIGKLDRTFDENLRTHFYNISERNVDV